MEAPVFSTPASTAGLGNPIAPGENGEVGSGDIFTTSEEKPKKKKMKTLKDYLKKKRVG